MRMADSLSAALPDLVVMIRRDGVILDVVGGRGVGALALSRDSAGQRMEAVWPDSVAISVMRATRHAIAQRKTIDTTFKSGDASYELRAVAQGPDRALCVIRSSAQRNSLD